MDAVQTSTDVHEFISIQHIQWATTQDGHLQQLKCFIIAGSPESKDQLHQDIRPYWSFRDDMAVIDGVIMEGRCIVIPEVLKPQVLDQLHINHMGIEETTLLVHKSISWANINSDIENHINNCTTCLTFQQTQPKDKIIHHDIPIRPWDVVGMDMFTINNNNYLYYRLPLQISHHQEKLKIFQLTA